MKAAQIPYLAKIVSVPSEQPEEARAVLEQLESDLLLNPGLRVVAWRGGERQSMSHLNELLVQDGLVAGSSDALAHLQAMLIAPAENSPEPAGATLRDPRLPTDGRMIKIGPLTALPDASLPGDTFIHHIPVRESDQQYSIDHDQLLPGEHGFRFFPAFYRNLFDTMRRTPVMERGSTHPHLVEATNRTVFDNLVPFDTVGIHSQKGGTFKFPRRRARSITEVLRVIADSFEHLEFNADDLLRFQTRMLEFATMGPRRRATLEGISWSSFLGIEQFSLPFQRHLDRMPQVLVALKGRENDARTSAAISLQLLQGSFESEEYGDSVLNGPTSEVWLEHWRQYLESLGTTEETRGSPGRHSGRGTVMFVSARLSGFQRGAGSDIHPVFECASGNAAAIAALGSSGEPPFYVIALPIHRMTSLSKQFVAAAREPGAVIPPDTYRDFSLLAALDESVEGATHTPAPGGLLDHMAGVQFFFNADSQALPGQVLHVDSPWALTSVSQPRFWPRRGKFLHLYRGLLSVDVCDFNTVDAATGRSAWDSTPEEFAANVWNQATSELGIPPEHLAKPMFYHIDRYLEFRGSAGPGANTIRANHAPYLVNRIGTWGLRAGTPGTYKMQVGRYVLAGVHMQTFTRLTSMEAANESGRVAANAILDRVHYRGDRVEVFQVEDREPADLQPLKDLDDRLFAAGAPHMFQIIDAKQATSVLIDQGLRAVIQQFRKLVPFG